MSSSPTRLEDFIRYLGRNPSEAGTLFVRLCAKLLVAMGFTDVFTRVGTELGRDIDARYGGFVWYFECKRYAKSVSTPHTAYKILQLDMLRDELRPDYFVLMSNASLTSILKDIVQFRNAENKVRYSIETWTNEKNNRTFDDILLSYSDDFIEFLGQNSHCVRRSIPTQTFDDFRKRSHQFRINNGSFFMRFCRSRAALIDAVKNSPQTKPLDGNEIMAVLQNQRNEILLGNGVLTIGWPQSAHGNIYDFEDANTLDSLIKRLEPWGVLYRKHNRTMAEFGENWGENRTFFLSSGAILTFSDDLFLNRTINPCTWLPLLREDCLRMRNFAKRGMLIMPGFIRTMVGDFHRLIVGYHPEPLTFGGWKRFLAPTEKFRDWVNDIEMKGRYVESDDILLKTPPVMHGDFGMPLAASIFRNSGCSESFIDAVRTISHRLLQRLREEHDGIESGSFQRSVQFDKALEWITEGEIRDTRYSAFQRYIDDYKE